jgi:Toastrack DUF4097
MSATSTSADRLEHQLAAGGTVTIETLETEVRLRAVDGRAARVRLMGGELATDFRVETAPDRLEIRPVRRWAFSLRRVAGPLEVEVPRDVRVEVQTASGSVLALDLSSGARVRTASGDVELAGAGGDIVVNVVSGSIRVRASSSASLELSSVSGRIDAIAASASTVRARSMSGALRLMAALRGVGPFSLETVSGEVTLGTDGPVRLRASTISGDIRSEVDGTAAVRGPGSRTMATGGSGPEVSARTVSGGIRLVAWRADGTASRSGAAAPEPAPDPSPGPARAPAAEEAPGPSGSGDMSPSATTSSEVEEARLAILRALARGEITVDEAGTRIDALEGHSDE